MSIHILNIILIFDLMFDFYNFVITAASEP